MGDWKPTQQRDSLRDLFRLRETVQGTAPVPTRPVIVRPGAGWQPLPNIDLDHVQEALERKYSGAKDGGDKAPAGADKPTPPKAPQGTQPAVPSPRGKPRGKKPKPKAPSSDTPKTPNKPSSQPAQTPPPPIPPALADAVGTGAGTGL